MLCRKRLLGAEGSRDKSDTRQKSGLVIAKLLSFREGQGPLRQTTQLVLIVRFLIDWLKVPFLRELKL